LKEKDSLKEQFVPVIEQIANAGSRIKPLVLEVDEIRKKQDEYESKRADFAV
jgi:uncharacterized coiled-coil DUF342 family protein